MLSGGTAQLQSPIAYLPSAGNFIHRTEIPGGFTTLTVPLELNKAEWEWWLGAENRKRELLVRSNGGDVSWHGRLEDFETEYFAQRGIFQTLFIFRGFYSGLNDIIDNTNHSSTTGKDIIASFLSDGGLDSSQEFMTGNTATISLDRSGFDSSMWRTIADVDGLVDIPSTNGLRMDFMVYEDKKVHYVERALSSTPWLVSLDDILSFNPQSRWRDFATKVAGRSSSGISSFTTDTVAQAAYGTRERVVGNSDIDATTAANMVTAILAERASGLIRIEFLSLNNVKNNNSVDSPLCEVRAGNTIQIVDLFKGLGVSSLNNRNTFYVVYTECVHENGIGTPATQLNLRLDVDRSDDAGILIQNGIRAKGE